MALRIVYSNLWKAGTIIAKSSEHPQYPATDTQIDTPSQFWRSRNGTGSGNGLFVIGATNKYIDFDEGGAELTATITPGSYNGTTLATEVKTQLDAAGGTYTVTYSETTGKFTIARAAGNFTLRWQSGTNTANTAGTTLGFAVAANDTGADTYTSDYARFHYPTEYIDVDLGVSQKVTAIAFINHNISASAVIKVYSASDPAFTADLSTNTLTRNGNNMWVFIEAGITNRYFRVEIADPTNSAGYIQIASIYFGEYWTPPANVQTGFTWGRPDLVDPMLSDALVAYGESKPRPLSWTGTLTHLTETDRTHVLALLDAVGKNGAWWICFDTGTPNSYSYLVRLTETGDGENVAYQHHRWSFSIIEVL